MARCPGHIHPEPNVVIPCIKEEHPADEPHQGWLLVTFAGQPHEHDEKPSPPIQERSYLDTR